MFSASISSISYCAKDEKLRTKFKRKCHDIRQGNAKLENLWNIFIQGFQLLEKYKYKYPDTVAECAVDLAETYKKIYQRCITPKDCLKYDEIFYQITPHLAQLLSSEARLLQYRSELLNIWSEILSKTSPDLRKLTFLEQTESVIIVIIHCVFFTGNYLTQLNGLELVLKYIKSVDRNVQNEVLTEIMPCNELRDILLDFRMNFFDEDSRTFLNIFNMKISDEVPVYSIVAISGDIGTLVIRKPMITEKLQQPLWIDFNSSKHTVSFFCENKTFFPEKNSRFDHKKNWILVEIAVHQITLNEELSLIHIKTADKIHLVPPSFEDDIRFNLEDIKDITLQFSRKNLILIKEAKILEFMNLKKNMMSHSQTDTIGFNIFHQFKGQKKLQKLNIKKLVKKIPAKQIQLNYEKSNLEPISNINNNNHTAPSNLKNDNDNFSNLKSSIVIPETTISLNSKQASKIIVENEISTDDNQIITKINQRKHMSRRESFETTFSLNCFVKLPILKTSKLSTSTTEKRTKIQRRNSDKDNEDNAFETDKTVMVIPTNSNNLKSHRYTLRNSSKPIDSGNNEIKRNTKRPKKYIKNVVQEKIKEDENANSLENREENENKITKNDQSELKIQNDSKLLNIEFQSKIDNQLKVIGNSASLDKSINKTEVYNKNENRKRKINPANQIVKHTVEVHQSPKSKIGKLPARRLTNDFPNNSSLRLVNMVRPLAKDKKNHLANVDTISSLSVNPLNVDTEQLNETVEEYARNRGYIGIKNKLKEKKNRIIYTSEELQNVFENLTVIDNSIQRTTEKFFKNCGPEQNVYDLEPSTSQPPRKRERKNTSKKTRVDTEKPMPTFLNKNKYVNYSYKQNIDSNNDEIRAQIQSADKENISNNDLNTEQKANSQIYDLNVDDNSQLKQKAIKENNTKKLEIPSLETSKLNNQKVRNLFHENFLDRPLTISDDEISEDNINLSKLRYTVLTKPLTNNLTVKKEEISENIRNTQQKSKIVIQKIISEPELNLNENEILTNRKSINNISEKDTGNNDLEITKSEQQIQKPKIQINYNQKNLQTREKQDSNLITLKNKEVTKINTEVESNKNNNITFSQKVRNFEELVESNKKLQQENKKSLKAFNTEGKFDQNITSESSTDTDSKKLIINTSVSTPNNLHFPINSNYNKIDDLMTDDEDDRSSNLIIKLNENEDINKEITITPNQKCDKNWLYEKFLNDINSENNNFKNTQNLNNTSSDMSIEPIRHVESKLPELSYLTFTKNDSIENDVEYPNDSVSAIQEEEETVKVDKINNNGDLTQINLEQLNSNKLPQLRNKSKKSESNYMEYSGSIESFQHDSSWRANTSSICSRTKCSSILAKTNKNVEIIETSCRKTIRIEGNNRTEERRVSLKRRFDNNNDEPNEEAAIDPCTRFKHELYYIANNIAAKYENASKYPNELNLQNDIEVFFKNYENLTKKYIESNKRAQNLRKKLKIEEDISINSLAKGIDMIEKLTRQLQHKKEYFENNINKNRSQFKQLLYNFKDSVSKLRNKIWNNHMDKFVQSFVENMKKYYKLDDN